MSIILTERATAFERRAPVPVVAGVLPGGRVTEERTALVVTVTLTTRTS
jgi:hypothetical protein